MHKYLSRGLFANSDRFGNPFLSTRSDMPRNIRLYGDNLYVRSTVSVRHRAGGKSVNGLYDTVPAGCIPL